MAQSCSKFLGHVKFQVPFDKILHSPSNLGRYVRIHARTTFKWNVFVTYLFWNLYKTPMHVCKSMLHVLARFLHTDFCTFCEWSSPSHPEKCALGIYVRFSNKSLFSQHRNLSSKSWNLQKLQVCFKVEDMVIYILYHRERYSTYWWLMCTCFVCFVG